MPSPESWQTIGLITTYCAAVIFASVIGGLLPEWVRLTHTRMQLMISFVGGVMLGIAVFHMIPHALVALEASPGGRDEVMWGVMLGLLATFFLLRFFHFHQHGPADFGIVAEENRDESDSDSSSTVSKHTTHLCSDESHSTHTIRDHEHQTGEQTGCSHSKAKGQTRWIAVLVGLGLHTLMDGVAMGAGITAESSHSDEIMFPGLGIFLAVLLHKPLDAVSITSLMHPVTTPSKRLMVNIGFALMCPLGAFLFWGGASLSTGWSTSFAGWGLAFSAGVFLCIALSDLLPEMEFHSHNRLPLTVALLLGILAALAIGLAEGEHAHGDHSHSEAQHVHDEHDHSQAEHDH